MSGNETALRKALQMVETWAKQRCPCENEQPNPCPLCGADATVPNDICLSAEKTMPRHILEEIRYALSSPPPSPLKDETAVSTSISRISS